MPRNAPIQSIERAVRILFAVAGAEEGRSIAQIAASAGINTATAWRLIRTLEDLQMLERKSQAPQLGPNARKLQFGIGPAVGELKHLDDERHLIGLACRVLVRWQAKIPTGNLGLVERAGHVSCERVRVSSARPGTPIIRKTRLHHPYDKASPLLFLAYSGPDDYHDFFRCHPFEPEGRRQWGTRARLDGFLADTCRRGYAMPDLPDGKWFRIAVPIFAPDGHLAAAVSGYVEEDASTRTRALLIKYCRQAAEEIGNEIGPGPV